jgi:hypothetical protein
MEDSDAPPSSESAQESAGAESAGVSGPVSTADYVSRREAFVAERQQERKHHEMTPARIERNRMNSYRSGKRAMTVSSVDYIKYRLGRVSKDLPAIIDACFEAQRGNLKPLEQETAKRIASSFILYDMMLKRVMNEGVSIKEPILDAQGNRTGYRRKAHPLLDAIGALADQLGLTAQQACLSRKSRGQDQRDAAITSALLSRDARLREARRLQLAAPDPDLLREGDEDLPA